MARLAGCVHLDGVAYSPDSDVPADVAARITNPKAWEGGVLPEAPAPVAKESALPPPPKSGKGSGVDEWRTYAELVGVEVAADAGRDDVVAAVESAGFATE